MNDFTEAICSVAVQRNNWMNVSSFHKISSPNVYGMFPGEQRHNYLLDKLFSFRCNHRSIFKLKLWKTERSDRCKCSFLTASSCKWSRSSRILLGTRVSAIRPSGLGPDFTSPCRNLLRAPTCQRWPGRAGDHLAPKLWLMYPSHWCKESTVRVSSNTEGLKHQNRHRHDIHQTINSKWLQKWSKISPQINV